jgi:hypothetical protein
MPDVFSKYPDDSPHHLRSCRAARGRRLWIVGNPEREEVAPHLSNACVEWMRAEWNRIALETSFLRSHDQCIEAVKEADVVLCIIDKRYGGCYRGANTVNFPDQNVSFKATVKKIESRVDIVVPTKDLSVS